MINRLRGATSAPISMSNVRSGTAAASNASGSPHAACTASKSSACSGRIKRGNTSWIETEVDAIRFDKLIEIYQPNVLKMDIETGEYGIIDRPMPECIRRMGIELHGTNKLDYARMMATIEFLEKDWDVVMKEGISIFGNECLYNMVLTR